MKKVSKVLGFSPPKPAKVVAPVVQALAPVNDPPVTPIPDTAALDLAAKKNEAMRKRTGRSSTLLTDDEDTTG